MRRSLCALGAPMLAGVVGCGDEPRCAPTPLTIEVPSNLGASFSTPERNPVTVEGAALGRALFSDVRLSGSGKHSCATCHRPDLAFTDGRAKSVGATDLPTLRHAPSLVNVAFAPNLFWDGGAHDLESQAFVPFANPRELAASNDTILRVLAADDAMSDTFALAFEDGLTIGNVGRALAQYERTLVRASSRYDRYVRGEPNGALSVAEVTGLARFEAFCAGCHAGGLFTDFAFHNNGLDDVFPEADERLAWGRGRITHRAEDIGKYKTPSLRNVARTAPYMHDGRFATLRDVLAHYRGGVRVSPTLDARIPPHGVPLVDADVEALLAFLETLTDE